MEVKFDKRDGFHLVSDTGRRYGLYYGHGIGADVTNDVCYVMDDWAPAVPVMVTWFFGAPEFDTEAEKTEFLLIVGDRVREYEAKLPEDMAGTVLEV